MTSVDLTIGSERNVRHLSHSSEFRRLFQCDMREEQRLQSYQPSIYEWDRLEGGSSGGEINWITTNKTKSLGDKTNKIYDPKGGWTLLKGDRKKETDNIYNTQHTTRVNSEHPLPWEGQDYFGAFQLPSQAVCGEFVVNDKCFQFAVH